jgi:tRNA U34 5-carboxymethylaminomethyl modifying enzyme MnmG/GidA
MASSRFLFIIEAAVEIMIKYVNYIHNDKRIMKAEESNEENNCHRWSDYQR